MFSLIWPLSIMILSTNNQSLVVDANDKGLLFLFILLDLEEMVFPFILPDLGAAPLSWLFMQAQEFPIFQDYYTSSSYKH